eukprot:782060-Lingulodinium_polyedra.AAC.1
MSPMGGRGYLPAGRKIFYYVHYRKATLERHGVTEADAAHARAYALASSWSKTQPITGKRASGDSANAEAYASASH